MMAEPAKSPFWYWIVVVLILAWNSFGGYDYTMTQSNNAAYLADFTAEQRAYFASFPWYAVTFWALGVWGAIIGSLLLFLRSRHAVTAFTVSLFGLAASTLWQQIIAHGQLAAIFPQGMWVIQAMIWAGAIGCLWFARWARRRALIR